MGKIKSILILFALILTGCEYFEPQEEKNAVARVNEKYLYQEDLKNLVNEATTPEDSAIIVNNYITRWATQQLMVDRAKVNLTYEKQKEFEELVERYKNELFTKAYADAYIAKRLDTSVSKNSIEKYYAENKENFKLNEDLVKLRYIGLLKGNSNFSEIKNHFQSFKEKDWEALEEMKLHFNSYSFNDSVWVKAQDVYERIPLLEPKNKDVLLKKSNFLELEDSLRVYLIQVNDVKLRNEQAPIVYVEPIIKQILLNRKKLELIKELEKDITKDAIKNKKFEIYK
ncbi:MAG TPA: peptidyl-prolyl cis-trans isomerase [Salinimicrobium sp.]|nr:peptidyl-prolyl cis-trans isomerase [Salinimicrobium sp.]